MGLSFEYCKDSWGFRAKEEGEMFNGVECYEQDTLREEDSC